MYGSLLTLLVLSFNILEYFFWIRLHSYEIYAALIALISIVLGVYLGRKEKKSLSLQKSGEVNTKIDLPADLKPMEGLTKREMEVLYLISKGNTNQEIAENLFVSLNTVKTHTSRLFDKLNVKNRTQALIKAKELGLG